MGKTSEQTDALAKLGQRIRTLRLAKGLSQGDLADLSELDRTYISGVERGKRNIAFLNLLVIANVFGVPLSEMLEGVE